MKLPKSILAILFAPLCLLTVHADDPDSPPPTILTPGGNGTGGTGTGGSGSGTGSGSGGTGTGQQNAPSRNYISCFYDEGEIWFESFLDIDVMQVTVENAEIGCIVYDDVTLGMPIYVTPSTLPYYIICTTDDGRTYSGYLSPTSY